jgi:hypothetical protein
MENYSAYWLARQQKQPDSEVQPPKPQERPKKAKGDIVIEQAQVVTAPNEVQLIIVQ